VLIQCWFKNWERQNRQRQKTGISGLLHISTREMCYYAITDYRCGDWRWGYHKQRCPRQPRMGEVCGLQFPDADYTTKLMNEDCKICQEILIKQRKVQKNGDNIERWSREGGKFKASIEKAQREICELDKIIAKLRSERPSVKYRRKDLATSGQPMAGL